MANKTTAPLDPHVADRLLDLLSTDDEFRGLFQNDPMQALERVGYTPATTTAKLLDEAEQTTPLLSSCLKVEALASKEVIAEARGEIRAMLVAGLAYHTPQLDASNSDDRFTLK